MAVLPRPLLLCLSAEHIQLCHSVNIQRLFLVSKEPKILAWRGANWNPNEHFSNETWARMEVLNSPTQGGDWGSGVIWLHPTPWNPSFAVRIGSRNERDGSESDLPTLESIAMQSCFNLQAILNIFFKVPSWSGGWRGWEGMPKWTSFFSCAKGGSTLSWLILVPWAPLNGS